VPTSATPSHGVANTGRPSRGCSRLTDWATGSFHSGNTRWLPRSGRSIGAPKPLRRPSAQKPVALTTQRARTWPLKPAPSMRAPTTVPGFTLSSPCVDSGTSTSPARSNDFTAARL
jgi:hypothetical protein